MQIKPVLIAHRKWGILILSHPPNITLDPRSLLLLLLILAHAHIKVQYQSLEDGYKSRNRYRLQRFWRAHIKYEKIFL